MLYRVSSHHTQSNALQSSLLHTFFSSFQRKTHCCVAVCITHEPHPINSSCPCRMSLVSCSQNAYFLSALARGTNKKTRSSKKQHCPPVIAVRKKCLRSAPKGLRPVASDDRNQKRKRMFLFKTMPLANEEHPFSERDK